MKIYQQRVRQVKGKYIVKTYLFGICIKTEIKDHLSGMD